MSDTAPEAPAETTEETEAKPATPKAPFAIKQGNRVVFGAKKGKIVTVRGCGDVPYDVQIRWDGEKYPEWHNYRSLQMFYDKGQFKIA